MANAIDILAGLQGIMGMGQTAGNMTAQGVSLLDSLYAFYRHAQRNQNPTLEGLERYAIDQFNQNPYGQYGDIDNSFGSLWGYADNGNPVTFGDMAAQQYNYMLNNNPATSAMQMLSDAGNMQRPGMPSFDAMFSGNPTNVVNPAGAPGAAPSPITSPVMGNTMVGSPTAPTPPPETIGKPGPGTKDATKVPGPQSPGIPYGPSPGEEFQNVLNGPGVQQAQQALQGLFNRGGGGGGRPAPSPQAPMRTQPTLPPQAGNGPGSIFQRTSAGIPMGPNDAYQARTAPRSMPNHRGQAPAPAPGPAPSGPPSGNPQWNPPQGGGMGPKNGFLEMLQGMRR